MATLIHILVDWLGHPGDIPVACRAPGESSVVLGDPGGTRVIILWNATQAQRDHKVIHSGNFRVQPQAIMGSGIVD